MTSAESPESGSNHNDEAVDAPGWGLPSSDPKSVGPAAATGEHEPPLTELQREVMADVAEAQRELDKEAKWRKAFRWDLLGGLFGIGGMLASKIDSLLASNAEMRATDAEREAQFLASTTDHRPDAEPQPQPQPHVLAGGPPTREEIYEAEMHPWPHHGMAETIEHNRGLREDPGDSQPKSDPPDTNAEQ
jgi:hypothetical protein